MRNNEDKAKWVENYISAITDEFDEKILKAQTEIEAKALFKERDQRVKVLNQLRISLLASGE